MAGPPIHKIKPEGLKGVSLAIFQNPNGYMISIQKTYKTKQGQWANTNNWFPSELVKLQVLLEEARAWFEEHAPDADKPREAEPQPTTTDMSTEESKTASDPEDPGPGFNGTLY